MIGYEIPQEEAEKVEVTCGFCDKRIAIRSLEAHVRLEHSSR
ncbi:MAG: hypothetical protein AB1608_07165 [Thermoproteota archaeon]